MSSAAAPQPRQKHPRGLATLFFTEMWERFSFYGLRAMLILYLVDAVSKGRGGLALDDQTAAGIYALYVGFVYLMSLPGGWVADRLTGQQNAVLYGGILIAAGQFMLAIPYGLSTAVAGLVLIVMGTGLLKPNVSTIVGQLYPEGGARRDAGFAIFYSGINLGALIAPLIVSPIAENINWHWGFFAAGCAMVIGVIQYQLTRKHLGDAGLHPTRSDDPERDAKGRRNGWMAVAIGVGAVAVIGAMLQTGALQIDVNEVAQYTSWVIFIAAVLFFGSVLAFGGLDTQQKKRVVVIFFLFIGAALFWSGFEQAGSSLTIFAERYTDRSWFGVTIPAGIFQVINPIFIIVLSPFFGALWVWLARRNLNPSIPLKFGLGLIQLGLGFLVMVGAAAVAVSGELAMPTWLILTYLLHTTAELCLSPVGLSSVTKLAPPKFGGQMMGTWFMGAALGNVIAGLAGGELDPSNLQQMPDLFMHVVYMTVGSGLVFAVFTKPIKKLIGNID